MASEKHYRVLSYGNAKELEIQLNDAYSWGYELRHVVARGETPGHVVAILELTDDSRDHR